MLDLLLLSRCERIIGSSCSSFAVLAAVMGSGGSMKPRGKARTPPADDHAIRLRTLLPESSAGRSQHAAHGREALSVRRFVQHRRQFQFLRRRRQIKP